jgi:hypothetical protein
MEKFFDDGGDIEAEIGRAVPFPSRRRLSVNLNHDVLYVNRHIWIPFGDHPIKLERYRED